MSIDRRLRNLGVKSHWWNNHTNKSLFTYWNKDNEDKYRVTLGVHHQEIWTSLAGVVFLREKSEWKVEINQYEGVGDVNSISGGLLSVSEALENSYNFENIGGLECKEWSLGENFNLGHQSDGILTKGK